MLAWMACCPQLALGKPFVHLTYAQIHFRITQLSQQYPNLLRIYSAQDRFSLPHVGNCSELVDHTDAVGAPAPCTIWVVELSNFDTLPSNPSRPEWIASGTLHGDEVVGPITTLAFIEYLVSNYESDPFVKRMLDSRLTTLVPMTNAIGFFRNERTELQEQPNGTPGLYIDPNRDFGFDQSPDKCMQSVAARTLNELFRVHLFRTAITFHGGTNALAYEWGDMVHCTGRVCHPAPDTLIMHALAERMSAHAGPAGSFESAYPVGDMGKLVYPVHGGMEDWGYGASWTQQAVVCTPETLGGYPASKTAIDRKTKRVVTYLVEMSKDKRPPEHTLGDSDDLVKKGVDGDGHVPRNVRLLLSAMDAVEPYVMLNDLTSVTEDGVPQAAWSVGGAFLVDSTLVQWSLVNGTEHGTSTPKKGTAGLPDAGGVGTRFTQELKSQRLPTNESAIYYRIAAIVDQKYAKPPLSTVPDVEPQSHLMGARASANWDFNVGDREIRGKRIFFSDTAEVRKSADGSYVQKIADDAFLWGEGKAMQLYSPSEAALFEIMTSQIGGGVQLSPMVSGGDGSHIVVIVSLVGVFGIVAIGVAIYIFIRRRRGRWERSSRSHLPFSVGDDVEDEKVALASDG